MSTIAAPVTLADVLPAVRWRSAALVAGGALLTAAAAQISIPLGFTPCRSPARRSPCSYSARRWA
jgi:hypothetical protein